MYTKTEKLTASPKNIRLVMVSGMFICLVMASLSAFAGEPANNVAYVDSVKSWGAWELDIEPAAGGIAPPSQQPLWARDPKVSLRTGSIAALTPPVPPQAPVQPVITPTPGPTPPPVVPPVGGPADGLF